MLLALVAMWGSAFALLKIAVAGLPPAVIVAGRLAVATLVLAPLAGRAFRHERPSGRAWRVLALIALIGNVAPFLLITWGQRHIASGLAGILMAVMPLTTLVLAHFFAHEPLTRRRLAGFAVGFLGIVVLVGPDALRAWAGSGTPLLAELAVLAGAVCYALAAILARRRPPGDATVAATATVALAAVMAMPIALAVGTPWPWAAPASAWAAVLVLGVVSTALAMVVYFRLIAAAGPSFLSLNNYLIPIWAVIVGALALGERVPVPALIALALVLTGMWISESGGPVRRP